MSQYADDGVLYLEDVAVLLCKDCKEADDGDQQGVVMLDSTVTVTMRN